MVSGTLTGNLNVSSANLGSLITLPPFGIISPLSALQIYIKYQAHPFGDTVDDPLCTNCSSIRAPFQLVHTSLCVMPALHFVDTLCCLHCSIGRVMVGPGPAGCLSYTPAGGRITFGSLSILLPLSSSNQEGASLWFALRCRCNPFKMGA